MSVWTRLTWAGAVCALLVLGGPTGCVDNAECGVCDENNLVLEVLGGQNYADDPVRMVSPECEGPDCPEPFDEARYFVERIGPCEETEEALGSARGPEEYCKISPLAVVSGLEFVFNNLLEPTTIELIRRNPADGTFQIYDFKTRVLELEGPITRYNGDYFRGRDADPDTVTRLVNLSCVDNLTQALGAVTREDIERLCGTLRSSSDLRPWKMFTEKDGEPPAMRSYGGQTDTRALGLASDLSCLNPEAGVDNCCSVCDFALGVNVAKYGAKKDATLPEKLSEEDDFTDFWAAPNDDAVTCDPGQDRFAACDGFVPYVDRRDETLSYEYAWALAGENVEDKEVTKHSVPLYDRLRETHPDLRNETLERIAARPSCTSTRQCIDPLGHDLPGTECIGTNDAENACEIDSGDPSCTEGLCRPQWFVECEVQPSTTGTETGYCVDTRFSDAGAISCRELGGTRLSTCDENRDGQYEASECCPDGTSCDPVFQEGEPLKRYERSRNLPPSSRDCVCGEERSGCDVFGPEGELASVCESTGRAEEYALKFLTREGGIIYDPALKGVQWRPADLGSMPRAAVESCAEQRGSIGTRNVDDGWRANDAAGIQVENYEDFDRALCSGQTYWVSFATPGEGEHIVDKADNTLEGKSRYRFDTPQFHVEPGSGFPPDTQQIGACESFSLSFSNKYDLSPENLRKLQIIEVRSAGNCSDGVLENLDLSNDGDDDLDDELECRVTVAGGPGCAATAAELEDNPDAVPCLTVDVRGQRLGSVSVRIDPTEFGPILQTDREYRLYVPSIRATRLEGEALECRRALEDCQADGDGQCVGVDECVLASYEQAFWDACGMPLVKATEQGGAISDFVYRFTIDETQCEEDADGDGIPASCDNAPEVYNADQNDFDGDGIGDRIDLCPVVREDGGAVDSDDDGIGNLCDNCRRATRQYNLRASEIALPAPLRVRNIPFQDDTDGDGIGDVCDNCVVVANCESYGPDNAWSVGDPIAFSNPELCQRDEDGDMIGDACFGVQSEGAAGPVGYGVDDDFDQDGLSNGVDMCPRQPVETLACSEAEPCPDGRTCVSGPDGVGLCNHRDDDGDRVGNVCDSCPLAPNPEQVVEGAMQEDDPDDDFVGNACELGLECENQTNPRAFGFYAVSAEGSCCTTALRVAPNGSLVDNLRGEPLLDPDGRPVTLDCDEATDTSCRRLPEAVAALPGVVELPSGCDEALAEAGLSGPEENVPLQPADVGGDGLVLWDHMCLLPQVDQDFDGVGDTCDLCPYAFDPGNQPYVDESGQPSAVDGLYCTGPYSREEACAPEEEPEDEGETEGETESTGTGG